MKRLLDTNAYAALKRGHADAAESARGAEELVLSIVVVGELLFGFRNCDRHAKNLAELEEFLAQPFVSLQTVTWTTADLGTPRVDLEDKEALRRVLDQRS